MTQVPSRLTWTCHVPVSITPPSLRPSLTTMLLNVQRSCTVPPPPTLTTHTTPATRHLPRQLTSSSLHSSASTLHIHPLVSPTVSPSCHLHCRSCSLTTTTITQDAFTAWCVRCHACTHACTHTPPVHRHHSMTPSSIPAKCTHSLYAATLHPAGAPVCTLGPVCPSQPTAVLLPAPTAQTRYYFPHKSTPASCLPRVAPALLPPHQTTLMPPPLWLRVRPHPAPHACC